MSKQTSCILIEISESKKFIEAYTSHSKSLEENIRRSEKLRQRNADENKNSIIQ